VLSELAGYLHEYAERFRILRQIDTAILNVDKSIDTGLSDLCRELRALYRADKVNAFVVSDGSCLPVIKDEDEWCLRDTCIPFEKIQELFRNKMVVTYPIAEHGRGPCILAIPVECDDRLQIAIVLYDELALSNAQTGDDNESVQFAETIAQQVRSLVKHKTVARLDWVKDNLVNEFFTNQMRPSKCWEIIVQHLALFLPDWHPLKVNPPPRVQILTHKEGDRHVFLRATQKADETSGDADVHIVADGIPLKVDETVCGILVERRLDTLLINPKSEYTDRYRAFLFSKNLPETELVVKVQLGDGKTAILNFEHERPNAFLPYHVELAKRAGEFLAPFISAVISREERLRQKEIGLLYVMKNLLRRMASTYHHKTGQLFPKCRFSIQRIKSELSDPSPVVAKSLEELSAFIDALHSRSKAFLSDMPEYVIYGRIDPIKALEDAMEEFDPEKMHREHIMFDFQKMTRHPYVYASQMLKEHLYNIFSNSIEAIRLSQKNGRMKEGTINIRMSEELVRDWNDKKTAPARIHIVVEDNGGGIASELYNRIFEFGFTTKKTTGGTGYGLPAALEYMQFVGGDLKADNYPGIGFSVDMVLQEYDKDYHPELIEQQLGQGD
jgi:signal transduction histidine kinase